MWYTYQGCFQQLREIIPKGGFSHGLCHQEFHNYLAIWSPIHHRIRPQTFVLPFSFLQVNSSNGICQNSMVGSHYEYVSVLYSVQGGQIYANACLVDHLDRGNSNQSHQHQIVDQQGPNLGKSVAVCYGRLANQGIGGRIQGIPILKHGFASVPWLCTTGVHLWWYLYLGIMQFLNSFMRHTLA